MTPADFPPPRRRGRNIHVLLALLLAAIVATLALLAYRQPFGLYFTGLVVLAVLLFIPIPILVYRLYPDGREQLVSHFTSARYATHLVCMGSSSFH